MALSGVSYSIRNILVDAVNVNTNAFIDPYAGLSAVDTSAVVSAVAALVADGASPTQAHVNTLSAVWAQHLIDVNNTRQDFANDVQIIFNPTTVLTSTILARILQQALLAAQGGLGGLTP